MDHWIILPLVLPLLTGLLLLLIPEQRRMLNHVLSALSALALVALTIKLLLTANQNTLVVYALGNWAPPFGIVLVLDRLSAIMLFATSTLGFFSLLYTTAEDAPQGGQSFHSLVHFLLFGVNGAFLTGDIFNLFVFFEVLLLSSYALMMQGGGASQARSTLHYVVLNLFGSSMFLIAVALLYGLTGTLNMADMSERVAQHNDADKPLIAAAAILLLLVFSLKAALVPLHFWLPRAYASASAPVAALFTIMTKVGIYCIIRVYTLIFGDTAGSIANLAQAWLWPLALITLVLGVIGALAARELFVQVAYLLIISVGTLLAGVAMHSEKALSATLFYLLHSTWICGAMFLLVDLIVRQRGDVGDNIRSGSPLQQPVLLGSIFFFGAISIVGMPPLSGFIGKALMLQAATGFYGILLWIAVLAGSLAMLTALSRSGSTLFWRTTGSIAVAPRADIWSLTAILGLIAFSLALMVWGNELIYYTRGIAEQVMHPEIYIRAVLQHQPVQGI